jgi:hypothetical protein
MIPHKKPDSDANKSDSEQHDQTSNEHMEAFKDSDRFEDLPNEGDEIED